MVELVSVRPVGMLKRNPTGTAGRSSAFCYVNSGRAKLFSLTLPFAR